jgi:hypothetical protein
MNENTGRSRKTEMNADAGVSPMRFGKLRARMPKGTVTIT